MITLSLDTTTQIASAAITENGKLLCEYTLNSGNTHSVTLLPMVKHMLETVKLSCRDVDLYAVSVPHGSYADPSDSLTLQYLLLCKHRAERSHYLPVL